MPAQPGDQGVQRRGDDEREEQGIVTRLSVVAAVTIAPSTTTITTVCMQRTASRP